MMGLLLKLARGIGSPDGSSPKGFTMMASGIADSFAIYAVLGMRSVVTLRIDLSELKSSIASPSKGAACCCDRSEVRRIAGYAC